MRSYLVIKKKLSSDSEPGGSESELSFLGGGILLPDEELTGCPMLDEESIGCPKLEEALTGCLRREEESIGFPIWEEASTGCPMPDEGSVGFFGGGEVA